jgi:hypothetical protein
VKNENFDLLANFNNSVNRWKSYFSQLLNVHNVSDVGQIEIHTADPLGPGPSDLGVEIAIAKLKKYKATGSDQILGKLIQAGGETLVSVTYKLINSTWNKEELPDQWKKSIIAPIRKKIDETDCNNCCGILLLSTSHNLFSNILLSWLSPYVNEITEYHIITNCMQTFIPNC